MSLAVAGLNVCGWLTDKSVQASKNEREIGDILVTTRADSEARILFAEDVEKAVGDDADVTGEFSLIGFYDADGKDGSKESTAVSVSAMDIEDADEFYKFEYRAYGSFNTDNLDTSAIVSESFAERAELSVGDTLCLRIVGEELTYTVEAIAADSGILREREVLISFSGLLELLSRKIPSVAVLGDSFAPCSRVMLKVRDGVSADAIFERISGDEALSDKAVNLTENRQRTEFWALMRLVTVYTFLVMIFLMAAFLIGTSLTLLHEKRTAEFSKFSMAGASLRQIAFWRCAECAAYAIIGVALGAAIAVPMTAAAGMVYGSNEQHLSVSTLSLVIGTGMAFALMVGCTLRHLFAGERDTAVRVSWRDGGWLLLLVCAAAIYPTPVKYRYIPCVAAIGVLAWLAFRTAPTLMSKLALFIEKRIEKRGERSPILLLALKNVKRRFALAFSCRLLAVMLALMSVISICERTMSEQAELLDSGIQADVVAYGLGNSAEQRIAEDDQVEQTLRLYYNAGAKMRGGATAIAISLNGSASRFVDEKMLPSANPTGEEIAISAGLAALTGVDVGDTVYVDIGGSEQEFTVIEVLRVNVNIFYFDADAIGARRNIVFIDFEDGADENAVKERIVPIVETDGAYASETVDVFDGFSENLEGHTSLMYYAMLASMILGLVGVANVFAQLYRDRRGDSELLVKCGMERSRVRRMYLYEALTVFLSAALAAFVFGGLMCILIDIALNSFGMVLFTF